MTFFDKLTKKSKPSYLTSNDKIKLLVNTKTTAVYNKEKNRLEFNPSPHLTKNDIPKSYLKDKEITKDDIAGKLKQASYQFETMEALFTPGSKTDSKSTKYQLGSYYHHQFLYAASVAWAEHYPLILSPIQFWILILQGVAVHVNLNSEKLRKQWVNHEGKLPLLVNADDFVLGSDKNDWTLLKEKTNKLLLSKVDKTFGKKWLKSLNPILDRFINIYNKDYIIDNVFWNNMIKRGATHGSGSYSYTSGWINAFLPYSARQGENSYCFDQKVIYTKDQVPYYAKQDLSFCGGGGWDSIPTGFKESNIPFGLASAPVQWMYLGRKLHMEFISGFMGYKQDKDDDYSIKPICGWSIIHTLDDKKKQQLNSESHLFGW